MELSGLQLYPQTSTNLTTDFIKAYLRAKPIQKDLTLRPCIMARLNMAEASLFLRTLKAR